MDAHPSASRRRLPPLAPRGHDRPDVFIHTIQRDRSSVGRVAAYQSWTTAEQLLHADALWYRPKQEARNRISVETRPLRLTPCRW